VFVGRRQQHTYCRVRTRIDPVEGRGGLAVLLDEGHHYEIEAAAEEVRLIARIGPLRAVVASRPVSAGPLILAAEVTAAPPRGPLTSPDTLSFGIEEADGGFTVLGTLDGKYLSTEVSGGFTGRVIGMYAAAGTVHFDWFDYEPLD
jgi:xylan 1,4-beta-xylosidase